MKYTFERFHQYTSHTNLTGEEYLTIEKANYNYFPNKIKFEDKSIDMDYEYLEYKKKTRKGYIKLNNEIKFKVETISISPDYNKENGNGSHHQRMTILSKIPLTFE